MQSDAISDKPGSLISLKSEIFPQNSNLPSFLTKKHKNTPSQYKIPQCDSCLEFQLFSDNKLLECISCNTTIHEQCQAGISGSHKDWQCERCTYALKNRQSYTFYKYKIDKNRCQVCGSFSGYLTRIGKLFAHIRCIRFIPELFTEATVYNEIWYLFLILAIILK
jgi:hypothetical protein